MTYGEFKRLIDDAGVKDSDQIDFIDIEEPGEFDVEIIEDEGERWIQVSN